MPHNRVVIFSNGIADVQRSHLVRRESPATISIPVRQTHVADVLASLNVFGEVRVVSPPSFRPVNENDGTLALDTKSVLENIAEQLSGARVRIDRASGPVEGTLVGLHGESEGKPNERVYHKSLVVLTSEGLVRVALRDVLTWRFLDSAVNEEIDKALKRNYQRIKPNSTFVEVTLTTEQAETEAVIQYTIPAAAWKISYRLLSNGDGYDLHGYAVVDNNTDEDWTDVHLAVVTGEPITFSTDLAESKVPGRRRVNVVRQSAIGAVEIEEGMAIMAAAAPMGPAAGGSGRMHRMAKSKFGAGGMAKMVEQSRSAAETMDFMMADVPKTEIREVGDFCLFEAQETVSIGSNRSAVVPVFRVALGQTKSVLHYRRENHPERPFRTVQFTNETGHALERGVCTVYEDGTYAGSCIIPSVAIGERVLLAHALESGVKIRWKYLRAKETLIGLRLTEGACHTKVVNEKFYKYDVENLRDETFDLLLDYDDSMASPERTAVIVGVDGAERPCTPAEELKSGVRYELKLAPKEKLQFRVRERTITSSVVELVTGSEGKEDLKTRWLVEHVIATNGPLSNDPHVLQCTEIQAELDRKKQEIADAVGESQRLAERQERLRKNIAAGGQDEQTARWRVDLGNAENRISEIDEKIVPRLREEEQAVRRRLRDALRAMSAQWETSE